MEKGKNRTDLLAAGRKKLQQFRQKKDVKATNSSSNSSNGRSSQKAGKHYEGGDAEGVPHDLSVDTESTKASQTMDAVETDAATGDQAVLPVTKLLVTLAEGGSDGAVAEQTPAESLASIMAGEANGKMEELKDSGDPPDPLSGDRDSAPCQTSDQDADRPAMEQSNRSIGDSCVNSELESSENGRHETGTSMPLVVKEDVPGTARTRSVEEDALPFPKEGPDKADDNISTSERVGIERINEDVATTCQGIVTEQEVENQKNEQFFASKNNVMDTEKTEKDAVTFGKLGFFQVTDAIHLPIQTTDKVELAIVHREETFSDECLDSISATQDTKREKEAIVQAYVEGLEKFAREGAEERDLCRLSALPEEEHVREDKRENPILAREAVEEFPGEGTSLMKLSSIPRTCTWNMEDAMEILKKHLYLTSVTKDFLQLQITDQIDNQVEIDLKLFDEVSRLQGLVQETQEKSSGIHEELDQCKNDLQVMVSKNKDLGIQCLSARGEIEDLNARVLELQNELELSQKGSEKLSTELADCKSVVGTLQIENSNLTAEILSGTEEIQKLKAVKEQSIVQTEKLTAGMCELQNDLEQSKKESVKLSVELAVFKGSMVELQTENSNLKEQILSGTQDIDKLKAEKDVLINEHRMLIVALSEQKDQLATALDKVAELDGDFKETMVSVEKLTEENIYLFSYLDVHKSKVKELENGFQELLAHAQGLGKHAKDSMTSDVVSNHVYGDCHTSHTICAGEVVDKVDNLVEPYLGQRPGQVEESDPNEPAVIYMLTGHLAEAEEMLQSLEKTILDMHAHHMSLSKSGGRVASSGVSKLIQAFESKAHPDTTGSDDMALEEGEKLAESDSYSFTKEHICNLKAILKQMTLDAEMTKVLSKKEKDTMCIAKKFEVECETLKFKNNELQKTIDELGAQLTEYKLNMDNLQSQLEITWQNADEMSRKLLDKVESLQKEVNGIENALGKEMNIIKDVISESSQKLDAHTGLLVDGNLDASVHLTASVNAVTKLIEDLQEKLEAACLDHDKSRNSYAELDRTYARLSESHESTSRILSQTYSRFAKLVRESSGDLDKPLLDSCENSVNVKAEELQQLPPEDFEILIERLSKLLNERLLLHSVKCELESGLALRTLDMEGLKEQCAILAKSLQERNSTIDELQSLLTRRDQDFDELNRGCIALAQEIGNWEINRSEFVIPELVENIEIIAKCEKMEICSIKQLLMHLGTLVTSLLQMYREATEQLNLSRNCLQETIFQSEYLGHSHLEPLHLFIKHGIIPRIMELLDFKEKVNWLSSKNVQQENEMQILKENLSKVEEALENVHSQLNAKVTELEQSEQRLSSVREKLSIAVSKGKGLVVQRDSLKQSLMEKTSELEVCLQELQSKEARLFDLEAKLKSSEADRVEALESELSYIRNSATAFRDSFLQKDSILQKIEEVMEELDLPEDFHSKDIVEKVEWLVKFVAENTSFQSTDWEQKGSLGGSLGGSQADPGLVATDTWKDSLQSVSSPGLDDLKRKYEELLSRFYGLAEQNDMLEQSLVERNDLVQRWENLLDRIDMPLQLKSSEPEERLEWLGRKLLEVQLDRDSLLTKIDDLEISTESLLSQLEVSQEKIADLDAALVTIRHENGFLSENLAKLKFDHLEASDRAAQNELEKYNLQREIGSLQEKLADLDEAFVTMRQENEFLSENLAKLRSEHLEVSDRAAQSELERNDLEREIAGLQEKLVEKSDCKACNEIVMKIKKLHDLLGEALPDQEKPDTSSSDSSIKSLESSVRKLVDNYKSFSLESSNDSCGVHNNVMLDEQNLKELLDDREQSLMALKAELDEVSHNLAVAKEERDTIIERYNMQISEMEALTLQRDALIKERETGIDKHQSLVSDFEATIKQRDFLQDQLNQEEQRAASMREKLNVAVRKGKGLVQQRDSLKQTVEEMKTELDHLKKELNQRVETLQSESNLLRNTLAESENTLHDRSQTLNHLLTALYSIDIGAEADIVDPIQRMEYMARLNHDLHTAVVSSENEAIKSRKAAELLVAEVNEVQERADCLQEDLRKAEAALAQYSRERDIAEARSRNAVSDLEQFMIAHNEEKKKQLGSIVELKDGIFQLRKGSLGLSKMLGNVLSRDVDLFCSMHLSVESIMKLVDGTNSVDRLQVSPSDLLSVDILSEDASFPVGGLSEVDISEDVDDGLVTEYIQLLRRNLYECTRELSILKEKLHEHCFAVDQQFKDICQMVEVTQSRIASRELSSDSLKRDISITHFEMLMKNRENELSLTRRNLTLLYEACRRSILELENRRAQVVGKSGLLTLPSWVQEEGSVDGQNSFSENFVRTVADSLLTTVKGSSDTLEELVEERQKELKATILDFQREMQEKDMQQNRICAELVSQIREAEAVAKKFSVDLDSAKVQVDELVSQINDMENHQKLSEVRINELKNLEAYAKEYEQRVKSLMDSLTAKDQEIEGLIQALDEEESQMESLQSRNQELEQVVRQNNLALKNLEASRAKALTKLSTTLSRFEELHHLSENLLAEIENLQSQIQERDSEISFLRQEVARCTNVVLAKQESNKKLLTDLHEVQTWMDTMVLRLGGQQLDIDNQNSNHIHSYIKHLDKQIPSVIAELEDLRMAAQNKDALLDIEKGRVNELSRRAELLEISLREKESQIEPSGGATEPGQPLTVNTQNSLEVEPMINKRSTLGSIVSHARSGRRVNSDHIAVAIDLEQDNSTLDDEDDDKAHGFKSLTTSKIVPRATRPVADRIDGLWVSIERLLMRQPSLRLGLILYWVVLHALLAASI